MSSKQILLVATLVVTVFAASAASAGTTIYWQGANANGWTDAGNWSGGVAPTIDDILAFQYATLAYQPSVGASVRSVSAVAVESGSGAVTINGSTGGALLLGSGSISVANTGGLKISTPVQGSSGLTKNGSGVLMLSANNTYSGATNITGGELQLQGTPGQGVVTSAAGLGLWLDASDAATITKDASNNVSQWSDKSGNNRNATASGTAQPQVIQNPLVQNKNVLRFDGTTDHMAVDLGFLNGTRYTILAIEGRTGDPGHNSYYLGNIGAATNAALHIGYRYNAAGTTYTLAQYSNDYDCPVPGYSGQVFRQWTNQLTATTHDIYLNSAKQTTTGAQNGNALTIGSNTGRIGTAINDNSGSQHYQGDLGEILVFNTELNATTRANIEKYLQAKWVTGFVSDLIPDSSPVTLSGGAVLSLAAAYQTETIGSLHGTDPTTQVNLGSGILTTGGNHQNTTFAGTISGNGGSLVKTGTGTMTLAAPSGYTGPTVVNNGILSTPGFVSSAITLGGASTKGTLVYTGGDATYPGPITVNAGGGQFTNDGGNLTVAGRVTSSGNPNLTVAGSGTTTVANAVNLGSGGLTKTGSGVMALSAPASYTGPTTIQQGTLRLEPVPDAPAGASLWLDASDAWTVFTDGNGRISQWSDKSGNGRNATQTNASQQPTATLNPLAANQNVVRFDGQTQQFSVDLGFLANTQYTILAVEGRTSATNDYLLGTSNGSTNNGLHFGYRNDTSFTLAQYGNDMDTPVPGYTGQVFRQWTGMLDGSGHSIFLNGEKKASNTNTTGFTASIGAGRIGTGFSDATGDQHYQGDLGEILIYAGALTAEQRQQAENYLMAKWVNGGILPGASPVSIAAGASLDINGLTQAIGPLSGAGNVTLGSLTSGTLTINSTADSTFSGTITGYGSVTKTGPGTLTLSGDSSGVDGYTGPTTLNAGTLVVNSPGKIFSTVEVRNNTTLAGDGTVGAITVASGGRLLPGALAAGQTVGTLTTGVLDLAAGSLLDFEFKSDASANDLVSVTTMQGLSLGGGQLNLFVEGTTDPFSTPRAQPYRLFQYTGMLGGSLSNLTIANPVVGRRYSLGTLTDAGKTYVGLTIASAPVWSGAVDGKWSNPANWASVAIASGDELAFDGVSHAADNTNDQTAVSELKGLTFRPTAGAFTIGGNPVTLTGDTSSNLITNSSPNTQTINLGITVGAGGQAFNAAAGPIVLGGTINNNGNSFTVKGAANTTINGVISGTGGLTKNGAGTLALAAENTYGGDTRVNGGALTIAHALAVKNSTVDMATAADSGTLGFAGGVTSATLGGLKGQRGVALTNAAAAPVVLSVGNNDASTSYGGNLSGAGGLTKIGAGTLTLAGTNSYAGATVINNGTLRVGAANAPSGAALWLDAADAATLTTDFMGYASQWNDKSGNGRNATAIGAALPLATTNALVGGQGVLRFDGANNSMNVDLSFLANNDYTILAMEGRGSGKASSYYLGSGDSGALNAALHVGYRANNQYTSAQFANDMDCSVPNFSTQTFRLWTDRLEGGVARNIFLNGAQQTTFSGSGPADATRMVASNNGRIGHGPAFGSDFYQGDLAEIIIFSSALTPAQRQAAENYLLAKWVGGVLTDNIPDASPVTVAAGATLDLNNNLERIGPLAGGGSVTLGDSGLGKLLVNSTAGNDTQFSGVISGIGGLVKEGPATLTLSGENTYTGDARLAEGVLKLAGPLALQNAKLAVLLGDSGTLDVTTDFILEGIRGDRDTSLPGVIMFVGNNGASASYTGALTGNVGVTKIGAGRQVFGGANGYTGVTAITEGTLNVGNGGGLPAASLLVFGGMDPQLPVLEQNGTFARTLGAAAGNVKWTGSGGFAAQGAPLAVFLNNGTATVAWGSENFLGDGQALIFGSPTADNAVDWQNGLDLAGGNRAIYVQDNTASADDLARISGPVSGNGGLTKAGPGTLALASDNSFTGGVTINAGTLRVANPAALNTATPNAVAFGLDSTGILQLNGNSVTIGGLATDAILPGAATVENAAATAAVLTVASPLGFETFAGVLRNGTGGGALGITKAGPGTLELIGANTFTGPITVTGGTLQGNTSSLPQAVTLAGTAGSPANVTYDEAVNATLSKAVSGTGSFTKAGTGALTLNVANSYDGATNIAGGELRLTPQAPAVANLAIWLDAAAADSITKDASGLVSQWNDRSGNGRNVTQGAASAQPTYATNPLLGDKPVVRWNGAQWMAIDLAFLANTPYTIFAVEGRTSGKNGNYFLGTENNGAYDVNLNLHVGYRNDTSYTLAQYANDLDTPVPGFSGQTFRLWSNVLDDAGHAIYLDGGDAPVQSNTNTNRFASANTGRLGKGFIVGEDFYQGDLAELLIVNAALGAAERQAVEDYLMAKWMPGGGSVATDLIPGASPVTISDFATLNLDGCNETIGPLAGDSAAIVNLGSGTLTVNSMDGAGAAVDSAFSGAITGSGALVKTGAGALSLDGLNDYTGGTRVEEGALVISSADALPAGQALTIGAGGTLVLGQGALATAAGKQAAPVAAVPEPGTLMLLAVAALLGAVAAWKRGRK